MCQTKKLQQRAQHEQRISLSCCTFVFVLFTRNAQCSNPFPAFWVVLIYLAFTYAIEPHQLFLIELRPKFLGRLEFPFLVCIHSCYKPDFLVRKICSFCEIFAYFQLLTILGVPWQVMIYTQRFKPFSCMIPFNKSLFPFPLAKSSQTGNVKEKNVTRKSELHFWLIKFIVIDY